MLSESMPEANDGPYTIEQAPNSGPVIRIGMRTFSESDVQKINERAAAKAESTLKQSYATRSRPFGDMLKRVSELNGGNVSISIEDLGADAAARWDGAKTISNALHTIRPMLEAKNCEGILRIHAYHFAGLEQFSAEPRAYAGIQARIISARPKDTNRVVLYQKYFFSKHEPVDAPDFASLYMKSLDKLVVGRGQADP